MKYLIIVSLVSLSVSCQSSIKNKPDSNLIPQDQKVDTATFAGGCFWCIEASFEQIIGVYEAVSGYSGGKEKNAQYKKVASGVTMHAETVQIYFNPDVITYEILLDIFFTAHDPTQLNRQGPDIGPQYRSEIFCHNQEQKDLAVKKIEELKSQFANRIVTKVSSLESFFMAEEYHQDYEKYNPYQPYILNVSRPKIDKVKEKFKALIKEDYK